MMHSLCATATVAGGSSGLDGLGRTLLVADSELGYPCRAFTGILLAGMAIPTFIAWLALAVGLLTVVLGARIARVWRDWRLVPLVCGLAAVCSGPILEILWHRAILDDAVLHRVVAYRSLVAALIALGAVIALRRLIEQERGLRLAIERTDALERSKAELESQLDARREAERAVLAARTRLSDILDNTPARIYIKDLAGRYLFINRPRVFADETAPMDQAIGKTDAEIFPPEVAAEFQAADQEALATGGPVEREHTIEGPRGTRTYIAVRFPLRDAAGEIYAIAGVSTDITQLAEATKTVRRIFELSPALMCTVSADGRFLTVNPAFERVLGYPASEFVGQHYEKFVHPDDLVATRETGLRLQSGGPDVVGFENRCRTRDGGYRVLSWHTIFVPSESTLYAAATDVTEQASQRETLRRIYELAPVAMATFDWRGTIIAVNPVLPHILGYTEKEMVGRRGLDFLHPDDVAVFRSHGQALSARAATLSAFEGRIRCKDGSYRTLSWDVSSAPDSRVFYAVARDVTEARDEEQRMSRRRDEMSHELRLQTIGELASEMSHELNQPLGAIVNFARGLTTRVRAGSIMQDELLAVLEKMAEQALRGGDLIRKLLVFARRDEIEPDQHDLNELVRDTISLLRAGREVSAKVVLALDESLPLIQFDEAQIQQVILNLTLNALDAVAARADGRVEIRTVLNVPSEIQLSITDNGPGVPVSDRERIFDAFYTTRAGGVGLGLPISRSIVQAHDGRLWVESAPGEGTTFHVTLPIVSETTTTLVEAERHA